MSRAPGALCWPISRADTLDRVIGERRRATSAQQTQSADEPAQRPLDAAAVLALLDVAGHAATLIGAELAVDVGRQAAPGEHVIEVESRAEHRPLTRAVRKTVHPRITRLLRGSDVHGQSVVRNAAAGSTAVSLPLICAACRRRALAAVGDR